VIRSVPQLVSVAAICVGVLLFALTLSYIDLEETVESAARLGLALPIILLPATGWQVLATREQIARSVDHMKLSYQYNGTFRWQELSKFDPLEDFGNSFAMYFYDPSGLKAQSPERYEWMAANLAR